MTCSRNFRRVLQASCLGLIGALTVVGCGGSETKPATPDGSTGPIDGPSAGKANLTAAPATVPLGSVDVGKASTPATVKITNNGTAAATSVTVTPSGVGISASGCGAALAIGGSCDVAITATPTAAGAIVGSVLVSAANGNSVSITVTGNAVVPGSFTVAPTTIPLGDLVVGATVPVSVTVTATAAITGLKVSVQGADLTLGTSASPCTDALAAGASCIVAATFSSTTAGSPLNDAIVVSQGGVVKSVPVTANVLAAAKLAATPAKADLAAAPGSSSSNLDINIGNIGGMTTGQLAVAITGTSFKIVSEACSVVTLAASKYCTVTVAYQPAASVTAAETGALTVTDKAVGGSVATVALTGTPNISGLKVEGGPALGAVAPGATGAEVVFTVTNTVATPTGALTASVGSTLVTISSGTCTTVATLNKGDTCTIGLKLAPPAGTTAQAIAGLLTVNSAAGSASASFTGSVVTGPTLTAAPASISFGSIPANQSSAVQTVTITNTGATPTSTLSVSLTGSGAAQVSNTTTCTGTLAPAATCTVSVTFSPKDTTGVNGSITVTDGVASVAVPMVGTGLAATTLVVTPAAGLDFSNVVLNSVHSQSVTVSLTVTTTASGDLSTVIDGDAKADYVVDATASTCSTMKSIQPGQSCGYSIKFTPSAVGTRAATLTVAGANGGSYILALTGKAWPLVQVIPYDATPAAASPTTGLDFGMWPNGSPDTDANGTHRYRLVVRGATVPTAASTVSKVVLATGTPADFVYVGGTNPCDGTTLVLPAAGTAPTGWSRTTGTPTTPSSGTSPDDYFTGTFWTCSFQVQFYPQSGKSATAKTATVTGSASAGGSDVATLSGIASGPLTISPSPWTFTASAPVGANLGSTPADTKIFTITNHAATAQGPLTVALPNASGDFSVIADTCSTATTLAAAGTCNVTVGFAPTVAGTRTATLTVSSPTESASVIITGTATQPAPITISPASTASAAADVGSASQDNVGSWVTFTVSNPTGGATTGNLTYGLSGTNSSQFQLATLSTISAYPAGSCGDSGSTFLTTGQTCTIQVRLAPNNTSAAGTKVATLTVVDPLGATLTVSLKGTSTAQLVLSGADVALDSTGTQAIAFGTVASGGPSTKSVTIANNGTAITLDGITLPTGFIFATTGSTCSNSTGGVLSLAAHASCTLALTFNGITSASASISFTKTGDSIATPLNLSAVVASAATIDLYGFAAYNAAAPVELGAAAIGASTGIVTLTFKNNGGVAATAIQSSFAASGSIAGTADFVVASENRGTCLTVGSLASGSTCTVNVRATPSAAGDRAAILSVFGLGVTGSTVVLHASGVTTSNSVWAAPVAGGTDTIYSFPSTSPYTGSTVPAANRVAFTLHNNGGTNITFATGLAVATPGSGGWTQVVHGTSGDFKIDVPTDGTGCGTTVLAGGGTCVFWAIFNPAVTVYDTTTLFRYGAVGTYSGSTFTPITGLYGKVNQPAKLQLSAASTGSVTVASLGANFGQIFPGQTPSLTFTITNIGDLPSTGQAGLSATGSGTYVTIGTSTCGATLAAGGTCTVVVNSQGTAARGILNTFVVRATDGTAGEASTDSYTLTALGVDTAVLTVPAPSSTSFADTAIGNSASPAITLTVRNGVSLDDYTKRQTTSALSVALSDSTNFAVDSSSSCLTTAGTAYRSLGAAANSATSTTSETCTLVLNFIPTAAGSLSTSVAVSATTGGSPTAITLTGTGLSDLSISPAGSAASPRLVTTTQVFTITNTASTAATKQLKSSLGGTNASAFAITTDNCYGNALSSAGSCTVTVTFVGTLSATAQTATLTVTDGTANSTASAALTAHN